jgi:hypothetical protein
LGLQSEVSAVLGNEARLIGGHVFLREDGADRAGGNARAAIDALVRVDVELIVTFVNAFDGADFDTSAVLRTDAGLRNNVSHDESPFSVQGTGLIRTVLARRQSHVKRDKLE